MKIIKQIGAFTLLLFLLTGCFDRIELEEQSYVIAIGIDKADKKGQFKITFQIANPEVGTAITGGGTNEEAKETVTLVGNDLVTATETANSFVTRDITLDHAKVMVVSEELARSGEFLRVIQSATRTTEIRRGVQIIVSKEKASDFLNNNKPTMETRPHKYYQFMLNRARETGIIPEASVHRFFQITEGDADLFLGIYATTEDTNEKKDGNEDEFVAGQLPHEGGNPTEFMGSAVFKEGKMIDVLSGQETRYANIFDNTMDMEALMTTYEDPKSRDYRIAASFSKKSPTRIDVKYNEKGRSTIDVSIPFTVEILAVPSLVNYTENTENQNALKKSIETKAEKIAEDLIKKTQEEYESEPFYWSLYVRKYFSSIKEYEEANWNQDIYPNAKISVNFQLEHMYFGKMLNDSNLGEVRD